MSGLDDEHFPESRNNFISAITPCILPTGISQGRYVQDSYKFYHPMVAARQLGMGQLPFDIYFANRIQARGIVTSAELMGKVLRIEGPPLGGIERVTPTLLCNLSYEYWWGEWRKHIFHLSVGSYLTIINTSIVIQVKVLFLPVLVHPSVILIIFLFCRPPPILLQP